MDSTAYIHPSNKMDPIAQFEHVVSKMEWGDVLSTLQEMVGEMLGDSPNPSPPSPPPAPVPAGLGFDTRTQPVDGLSGGYGNGECTPIAAAPDMSEQPSPLMSTPRVHLGQAAPTIYQEPLYDPNVMQSGQLYYPDMTQSGHRYSQAGAYSQGQYAPYQWPVNNIPSAATAGYPAAHPLPYSDVPVVSLPVGMGQNLPPVGVLNGEVVYGVVADSPFSSPTAPPNISMSKSNYYENLQAVNRPYVKKPPNAFMLFMKDQRPNVVAELSIKYSATVNTILGQRWKSLSWEEKAKYYNEAEKERQLHSQRHPDWSPGDNYGKKRKRQRRNASAVFKASASEPEEITQPAKRRCVTPVQSAVTEPPATQTDTTPLPMCEFCHLPQVYQTYWMNSPPAASTALVSPTAPTETQTTNNLFCDNGAA